ncbi:hypothetical protein EP51_41950 (plasmid) [Rhodococcus opacus]|uniref:Uncharacterized protein n=1 Tax=Rhodococcus opacus TaxID=37919 RepID=A0A076EZV1_RHOOP|nr:hypothetical protein EP51_41950 [Rhodococcus opacus]
MTRSARTDGIRSTFSLRGQHRSGQEDTHRPVRRGSFHGAPAHRQATTTQSPTRIHEPREFDSWSGGNDAPRRRDPARDPLGL